MNVRDWNIYHTAPSSAKQSRDYAMGNGTCATELILINMFFSCTTIKPWNLGIEPET